MDTCIFWCRAPEWQFDELPDPIHLSAAPADLVVSHLVQTVVILPFDWLACLMTHKGETLKSHPPNAIRGLR